MSDQLLAAIERALAAGLTREQILALAKSSGSVT